MDASILTTLYLCDPEHKTRLDTTRWRMRVWHDPWKDAVKAVGRMVRPARFERATYRFVVTWLAERRQ
jgi:hypothetical protein